MHDSIPAPGVLLEGFTAMIAPVAWTAIVLFHGIWRSIDRPAADAIRPSGPF